MTIIGRPVRRETFGSVHERGKRRNVIVILEPPNLISFRAKGTRRTYTLTTDACWTHAVKVHVESEKARKRKERSDRRKARAR